MFPEFHADKPLDKLIRPGIEPEHIKESVLGRALDQLFELDVSEVYFSLDVKAINVLKLPCKALNLDSTAFMWTAVIIANLTLMKRICIASKSVVDTVEITGLNLIRQYC